MLEGSRSFRVLGGSGWGGGGGGGGGVGFWMHEGSGGWSGVSGF